MPEYIDKLADDRFIKTLTILYAIRCRKYRDACEAKDEKNIELYGKECSAFEDVAESIGVDIALRNPFESYEGCENCVHWDAHRILNNPDIES